MTVPTEPAAPRGRPTLRTLAQHTGLHVSTISRALRRTAGADQTAALVHAAAAEIGYRRDPVAASLRTHRSHAIGVVSHALTDVVQAMICETADRIAVEAGYDVLVAATRDDPATQRQRVELLLSRRVDGLIIGDAHEDGAYADWIASLGVPYVLVMRGTSSGSHPAIVCDDEAGGRLVAEHLIERGHTRIAMLTGPGYSAASTGRARGFADALAEHGAPLDPELVAPGGLFTATGRAATVGLLDRGARPTAVFCANDFAALGAIGALHAAGMEPGRDVAVAGFNDVPAAEAVGLTSVSCAPQAMGELATRELLRAIGGEQPESRVLAPELIVRRSSSAAPVPR